MLYKQPDKQTLTELQTLYNGLSLHLHCLVCMVTHSVSMA